MSGTELTPANPTVSFLTKNGHPHYYLISFLTALFVNVGVSIIAIFVFMYTRRKKHLSHIYTPRLRNTYDAPEPLPDGFFNWLPALLNRDDYQTLFKTVGPDGVLYLKFTAAMARLSGILCGLGLFLAIMHGFGHNNAPDDVFTITMAHIPEGDDILWGDAVFFVTFNIIAFISIYRLNQTAERLRMDYFETREGPHALLIRDVDLPHSLTGQRTSEALEFLNGAQRVYRILNTSALDRAVAQRDRQVWKLRHQYLKHGDGHWRTERHREKVGLVDRKCGELIDKSTNWTMWLVAVYRTERQAHAALLITSKWRKTAQLAPMPEEMRWSSFYPSPQRRVLTRIIVTAAVYVLAFFYVAPVSFFNSYLALTGVPFLSDVVEVATPGRGIATGVVPSLGVIIFVALLPFLLKPLAKLVNEPSTSRVEMQILSWYWVVTIICIYLASLFAAPVWIVVEQLKDPQYYFNTVIANTWPVTGLFFMNLFIMRGITAPALRLLRPFQLLVISIAVRRRKGCCGRKPHGTPQEVEKAFATDPEFKAGKIYATHTLVFLIMICWGVATPLFLPVAVGYFCSNYLCDRYKLMFVFKKAYETGGAFWPYVLNRLLAGLLVAQASFIALLGIKKSYSAILVAPLIVFTAIAWLYVRLVRHRRFETNLTVEETEERRRGRESAGPDEESGSSRVSEGAPTASTGDEHLSNQSLVSHPSASSENEDESIHAPEGVEDAPDLRDLAAWDTPAKPSAFSHDRRPYYAPGEVDRLGRICYLGSLCKPGVRVAREYMQPSVYAGQQRVSADDVLADLVRRTQPPEEYDEESSEEEGGVPDASRVFEGPGLGGNV